MTLLIGAVTVVGAGIAAWIGASRTTEATRQRESAAAREEWFRRLQWAGALALSQDEPTRTAGLALMQVLARSPLAGPAELDMLTALNDNTALDRYHAVLDAQRYGPDTVGGDSVPEPPETEDPDDDDR